MGEVEPNSAGFSDIDKSKDTQYFVDFVDRVRLEKGVKEGKELSFSLLRLRPGDAVLDVGCGAGDDVLSLAKIVGESGRAIGIDNSEAMVSEARRRAAQSTAANAQFLLGSIYHIDFPDQTFNGVMADRVFQHLEDPHKAFTEVVRVAKKGNGRIVVHDPDWDSLVIDSEFKEVTRKITKARSDWLKNGKAGSRVYGMFKEAGLANVTISGWSPIFTDYNYSFQHLQLEKASRDAAEEGLISVEERAKWVADLRKKGEQGRFFAAFTAFIAAGTRP
ncbi:MAG: methyltransferase domain-containing protein [Thaumarchaeota archaeon]|nr:methyltransferase domain-containing protein [Nitrososphaerota archaeon]